ncbi:hypothetical protein FGO68_gene10661 [Halteria grandinella]|uniref:Ankyrin repeat domain-containing protein n=1 Tax=Halteria grandinella TaxID=5974 RepID=A0A8J8SX96_HALGN|nr:hypothetical protein FGO68_gene10661 [Halteria grandinella]
MQNDSLQTHGCDSRIQDDFIDDIQEVVMRRMQAVIRSCSSRKSSHSSHRDRGAQQQQQIIDRNHSQYSKSQGRQDSGDYAEEQEYSEIEGSDNDGDDVIFDDMKLDELSSAEVKMIFKRVKEMLEKGDQVSDYTCFTTQLLNYSSKDTQTFLIHYACEFGSSTFLTGIYRYLGGQTLLAQLKLQTLSGKSSLHLACQTGNPKVIHKILAFTYKSGESLVIEGLTQKTQKDQLPLHLLLLNQRQNTISQITKCFKIIHYYYSILMNTSLKVSEMYRSRSKLLEVPIELVISKGYLEILSIMLAQSRFHGEGWDGIREYEDQNGNNLLHQAVANEEIAIVRLLLKEGINPSKMNKFGQTPYQIAYENGLMEICYELQQIKLQDDSQDIRLQQAEMMVNRYIKESHLQPEIFGSERFEKNLFKEVIVHLDLKGAPLKFTFLLDFIKYLGTKFEKVATGVLFEFEDTFPYDGYLSPLRGEFFYTKDQIKLLKETMANYKLKLIPLIQTFGHLEFALK